MTCWHFVANNTKCNEVVVVRLMLNVIATSTPMWQILLSQVTPEVKLTKGEDILVNSGQAVLNSCWEQELRAMLLVYKWHGKWDINAECISVLPQVCKRMVDETMNYIFAILKRKRQRDIIPAAPNAAGKIGYYLIKMIFRLSEFFPALYAMFSDVIYQNYHLPYIFTFCKDRFGEECEDIFKCRGLMLRPKGNTERHRQQIDNSFALGDCERVATYH